MTAYTHRLKLTIPASLYDVACAIARALDVDSGGANSWGQRNPVDSEGSETTPTHYVTETPCTEAFHTQALAMLQDAAMLHAAVTADYAARWPDLTPPTLAECEAFVAGVVLEVPQEPEPEPELLA